MAERMQALVLHGVGDLRLEEAPVPVPAPGQARVRIAAAGVCGSDLPRIYEHGAHRLPLIPGHECSGIVVEAPGSEAWRAGDRVTIKPLIPCGHCRYCQIGAFGQCEDYDYIGSRRDGAFAEYVCVPQANLLRLPEGADLAAAALTEPAAVALHALRQGGIAPGDVVAILGAGPIGMLAAQWARVWGAGRVLLVDLDDRKLELARRLWLGDTFDARQGDAVAWANDLTGGRGVDLVLEAAGAPATFETALRLARPLGRVVMMGNPARDVTLPQATISQMLRKELTVRGTWNSHFVALPVDEWQVTVDAVAARRVLVPPLISHRVPLAQGVEMLTRMRAGAEFYMRALLVNEAVLGGKLA